MKWLLVIWFASGAVATREMPDRDQCEIARSIVVKRIDIMIWMNPEHRTAQVAYSACVPR